MKWYCEHLDGRLADVAKNCNFLDKDVSDGAVLVSNGGKAGAWYFDDEIDTRPSTVYSWKTVEAHTCNCKCENECPVARARQREIENFVECVMQQGPDKAWWIHGELYGYLMTMNNPMGATFPRDIQLPHDYAEEAEKLLYARLMREKTYGHITNN